MADVFDDNCDFGKYPARPRTSLGKVLSGAIAAESREHETRSAAAERGGTAQGYVGGGYIVLC